MTNLELNDTEYQNLINVVNYLNNLLDNHDLLKDKKIGEDVGLVFVVNVNKDENGGKRFHKFFCSYFDVPNEGDTTMADKWLQSASDKMEKKGTKGSFTKLAKKRGGVKKGGGIKENFIETELHSKNPKIRKKAQFAKNMKKIAK